MHSLEVLTTLEVDGALRLARAHQQQAVTDICTLGALVRRVGGGLDLGLRGVAKVDQTLDLVQIVAQRLVFVALRPIENDCIIN